MIHLPAIQNALRRVGLGHWAETLPHAYSEALKDAHGNLGEWQAILRTLPRIEPSRVRLDLPAVTAGDADTANASQRGRIQEALGHLHPWQGPLLHTRCRDRQ